jgi:pyruvate/2-oxoacid:ferredoxin oxidoreductase beta subunit
LFRDRCHRAVVLGLGGVGVRLVEDGAYERLALQAIAYGDVYVARVATGADPQQTLRAIT